MARRANAAPMATGLAAEFLQHCRLELGLSANTLRNYATALTRLQVCLEARALAIGAVGPDEVGQFLGRLRDEDRLAPASLALTLSAWRMYSRWLVMERHIDRDRIGLAATPEVWNRLPGTLSVAEVDRLLASAPPGPLHLRDRLALELLYACGGRASEVAGLGLADLREEHSLVHLRGKGDKQRLVPLGERARTVLADYLKTLRPTLVSARSRDHLLLGPKGAPMTRQGLWRVVQQAGEHAGLGKPVWTHLLRHAFATHLLAGGANLRAVQELLGHSSLTTTQRYTRVEVERLAETHRRFHPRA